MSESTVVIMMFLFGIVILISEIFIPSHGILGIVGVGFLVYAVYRAYALDESNTYGHIALLAAMVLLPTLAITAVKIFHRTPLGRKIAPDNPIVRAEEFAPQFESLKDYVGQRGRSITPLRPVGTCIFNGQRVNCVAESGLVERGVEVEAVGVRGHEVEVRLLHTTNA